MSRVRHSNASLEIGEHMKFQAGHRGFGLIEVLVTLLIVSIGLLTIAKFQSSVTSESRFNKTRSEAKALCEDALTPYRQPLTLTEFNALGNTNSSFIGTTETISLSINAVTTAASTKALTATCTWGSGGPEETIQLVTEVTSNSLTLSALSAGAGDSGVDGLSPSLNAGASDEISDRIQLFEKDADGNRTDQRITDDNGDEVPTSGDFVLNGQVYVVDETGNTASAAFLCSTVDVADNSLGTRGYTLDASNNDSVLPIAFETFKARRLKDGNGAVTAEIELFEPVTVNSQEYCIPRVRYNGGVIVPIRGTISSGVLDNQGNVVQFNLFTFDISESGTYCVLDQSDPNATSVPYSCYVGGNCTNGPAGSDDNDFFQCPSVIPSKINIDGPGGWRGRIGVLGLAELGYSTCYFEEVKTDVDGTRDTARNYYARYSVSAAVPSVPAGFTDVESYLATFDKNQGLNQPQLCHDFMIIDAPNSPQYSQFRAECVAAEAAVANINLASKNIQRDIIVDGTYSVGSGVVASLSEDAANVYNPVADQTWCNIPTYILTVVPLGTYVGIPEIRLSDDASPTNGEFICDYNLDSNNLLVDYTCEFESSASAFTVSGNQGSSYSATAPCDEPLDIDGAGGITDSSGSAVSSCSISFSAPPVAEGYTLFTVSGSVTASAGLDSVKGVDSLVLRLNDSQTLGCTISLTSGDSTSNPYQCVFYAKTTDSASISPTSVSSGYALDTASFDGTTDLGSGLSITGPDIPLIGGSVSSPYTVTGTVSVANNVIAEPTISSEGNRAVCSFTNPPATLAAWENTNTAYTCTVDSGQATTLTFAVSPDCEGGSSSKAYLVSVEGGTGVQGLNTYSATADAIDIAVSVTRGGGGTCQ